MKFRVITISFLFSTILLTAHERSLDFWRINYIDAVDSFDSWSISQYLFDFIRDILEDGKILLEFGSGWASGQFSKYYTVYSIEHSPEWLNRFDTHYIFAPIKNGWYDIEAIKQGLPKHYDLILVDGPPATIGRGGLLNNLHLFNTNVPIIFDDVQRKTDYDLMVKVAKKLGKDFKIFKDTAGYKKAFGIVA